jgi:NTE family protein
VLFPFLRATETEDVLVVQINPVARAKAPVSAREIMNRVNEITFNASLLDELRTIAFVNGLIDQGRLPRGSGPNEFRRLRLHRIAMDTLGAPFDGKSRLVADYRTFETLHKQGQRATRRFLDAHFFDIGARGTLGPAPPPPAAVA